LDVEVTENEITAYVEGMDISSLLSLIFPCNHGTCIWGYLCLKNEKKMQTHKFCA
jgi:hypothetical protein